MSYVIVALLFLGLTAWNIHGYVTHRQTPGAAAGLCLIQAGLLAGTLVLLAVISLLDLITWAFRQ